jgi:hypothetical protein
MTTQEMMDEVVLLIKTHLHSYKADAPTDAQKLAVLNWAQIAVAKKIGFWHHGLTLTLVADQKEYNLRTAASKRVTKPDYVIINGNKLKNAAGDAYGIWTIRELEREYPTWRSASSGTPGRAAYYNQTLIIHQPPTAAIVSAGENYIAGRCLPAPLAVGVEPDLPEESHMPLCLAAAVRHALPTCSEDYAWKLLEAMGATGMDELAQLQRENENSLSAWGSTPDFAATEVMLI